LREVAHTLFHAYRQRSLVGLALMTAQSVFSTNAIFFTFCAGLDRLLRKSPPTGIGWYLLPFAAGNFLGPLLLGRLFDTLGRPRDDYVHLRDIGHSARAFRAICSRSA